jgi:hypothetical protein
MPRASRIVGATKVRRLFAIAFILSLTQLFLNPFFGV